jgi:hypothetical protein
LANYRENRNNAADQEQAREVEVKRKQMAEVIEGGRIGDEGMGELIGWKFEGCRQHPQKWSDHQYSTGNQ